MEPDAIDLRAGKKLVFRAGDPLSNGLEWVIFKRGAAVWNSQKTGLSWFARAGVFDAPFGGNIDDLVAFELMAIVLILTGILENFVFDPGKDACPMVIIVLHLLI